NNRVDGVVLRVLLRKAETIRNQLGVSVPVPFDGTAVLEAIFDALFLSKAPGQQLALDLDDVERRLDDQWKLAADREQQTRTIFAQHSLHPDQVRSELKSSTLACGSGDVESFVRDATQRLGSPLYRQNGAFGLDLSGLPEAIPARMDLEKPQLRLAF